jgi:hypothetical protein
MTKQFGTSTANHVGLGEALPRFLDGEQPTFETIPHDVVEMRTRDFRCHIDDGAQRSRATDATDRGDVSLWHVASMNDDLILAYQHPLGEQTIAIHSEGLDERKARLELVFVEPAAARHQLAPARRAVL